MGIGMAEGQNYELLSQSPDALLIEAGDRVVEYIGQHGHDVTAYEVLTVVGLHVDNGFRGEARLIGDGEGHISPNVRLVYLTDLLITKGLETDEPKLLELALDTYKSVSQRVEDSTRDLSFSKKAHFRITDGDTSEEAMTFAKRIYGEVSVSFAKSLERVIDPTSRVSQRLIENLGEFLEILEADDSDKYQEFLAEIELKLIVIGKKLRFGSDSWIGEVTVDDDSTIWSMLARLVTKNMDRQQDIARMAQRLALGNAALDRSMLQE